MQKFQCLLFVLKRSYICYYIICMNLPLMENFIFCAVFFLNVTKDPEKNKYLNKEEKQKRFLFLCVSSNKLVTACQWPRKTHNTHKKFIYGIHMTSGNVRRHVTNAPLRGLHQVLQDNASFHEKF